MTAKYHKQSNREVVDVHKPSIADRCLDSLHVEHQAAAIFLTARAILGSRPHEQLLSIVYLFKEPFHELHPQDTVNTWSSPPLSKLFSCRKLFKTTQKAKYALY
jgi:hypothetical protein